MFRRTLLHLTTALAATAFVAGGAQIATAAQSSADASLAGSTSSSGSSTDGSLNGGMSSNGSSADGSLNGGMSSNGSSAGGSLSGTTSGGSSGSLNGTTSIKSTPAKRTGKGCVSPARVAVTGQSIGSVAFYLGGNLVKTATTSDPSGAYDLTVSCRRLRSHPSGKAIVHFDGGTQETLPFKVG
jgi:hypothetical protein